MNVLRGVARWNNDHYLVEGRIRANGNLVRQVRRNIREVVKMEQLDR